MSTTAEPSCTPAAGGEASPGGVLRRLPTLGLLATLVVMLAVSPMLADGWLIFAEMIANLTVLWAGVVAISFDRGRVALGVLSSLPFLAMTVVEATAKASAGHDLDLWTAVAMIPFAVYVAQHVLRHVAQPDTHFDDRLIGSAAAYLLIGFGWAGLYAGLLLADPGALVAGAGYPLAWGELQYFSFVTLTTLGYGDIAPQTPVAQGLTLLEAVAGVFFLAFLVARLMSLHAPPSSGRA